MNLKIQLPAQIFAEKTEVQSIVAESRDGSFGILPHRRDCVAALVAGIFTYQSQAEGKVYLAVDQGILVKTGTDVLVSVRRAIGGTNLGQLREAVKHEFLVIDQSEKDARAAIAKMESGFVRRFLEFHHE